MAPPAAYALRIVDGANLRGASAPIGFWSTTFYFVKPGDVYPTLMSLTKSAASEVVRATSVVVGSTQTSLDEGLGQWSSLTTITVPDVTDAFELIPTNPPHSNSTKQSYRRKTLGSAIGLTLASVAIIVSIIFVLWKRRQKKLASMNGEDVPEMEHKTVPQELAGELPAELGGVELGVELASPGMVGWEEEREGEGEG